ncbi:WXG100 family type VII secretion target [Nocardia sienata]|uniref:WXG100 family type VII secretion target n=1 Tax=Nocardia sienata TaxID=248552 RepID=UPI0007A44005|nr:WXG100 family type VII secretion target [Nocardia sienata]
MGTNEIYTDKALITEALTKVKGVTQEMRDNITTLNKMKEDLLAHDFQGAGAQGYDDLAVDLDRRLKNYEQSIANLDRSTENAANMIGDADADVARLFRSII